MDIVGNAHSWWQYKVSHWITGTSLHVWSIADKSLLNHPTLEKPFFTKGDVADEFVKRKLLTKRYGTVISHILLGKAHPSSSRNCDWHMQLFKDTIAQACRVAASRIIIAEANPASCVFSDPCLPAYSELKDVISTALSAGNFALTTEDYSCGDSRWGGDKSMGVTSNRNVFFIADRKE